MKATRASSFAVDVRAFTEKFKAKAETVVKKVLFDMSTSIVQMSPVDTGRFRANWQFAEGSAPSGNPDGPQVARRRKGYQKTHEGADSTIARLHAGISGAPLLGTTLYLVNNLPYAIPLEYGHSDQAPGGMVRITAERYNTFFANAVKAAP